MLISQIYGMCLVILGVCILRLIYKGRKASELFKIYIEKRSKLGEQFLKEINSIMNGKYNYERLEFINDQINECEEEYLINSKKYI